MKAFPYKKRPQSRWRLTLTLALLLPATAHALSGCSQSPSDDQAIPQKGPEEAQAKIDATIRQWLEAMNRGDAEAVLALTAEGCTLLSPEQIPISGRDSVAAALRHVFEEAAVTLTYSADERKIDGGLAVERGRLVRALHPRNGDNPVAESFNLVTVFQQEGESWKILWQIWNSNLPSEGG